MNEPSGYYESNTTLAQYLEFHFGESWHGEANFAKELADAALGALDGRATCRALDIGCAVGRTSLELARQFDHVDGVDYSETFIGKCREVVREGVARYARPEEGELVSYQERSLAALGLTEAARRVAFHQGDACNLGADYRDYDLVLAGNLIDRLYNPCLFLEQIHERINALGLLVIASPYTWLEEYTPRQDWLGGFLKDGEPFTTLDGLKAALSPRFRLLEPALRDPGDPQQVSAQFFGAHNLGEVAGLACPVTQASSLPVSVKAHQDDMHCVDASCDCLCRGLPRLFYGARCSPLPSLLNARSRRRAVSLRSDMVCCTNCMCSPAMALASSSRPSTMALYSFWCWSIRPWRV